MFLSYNLDIKQESKWLVTTPHPSAYNLPFYVTEVGHFYASKGFYTERSAKNKYYVLYTVSGRGHMKYHDEEFYLEKGHAVMIHCNDYHLYKTASDETWDHKWIHFDGESCDTYMKLINDNGTSRIYIENNIEFENYIDDILRGSGVSDIKQSVYMSKSITNILTMMVLGKYNTKTNKNYYQHQEDIQKVIEYIRQNYAEQIVLDDLISVVHLSKYYFLKLFKQNTGMTPYEYLINYRINKAKVMLRTTGLSVMAIGLEVGFTDESNFIKQFKKVVRMTPLNYRKSAW